MKTPDPIDAHAGRQLRILRQHRGLSQSELAAHCNVSFQQIQKYEKGANRISASRLQQLAELLEVSPAFFFDGASAAADSPVASFLTDRDGAEIARLWQRIDTARRATVLDLMRLVAVKPAPEAVS